MSTSDDNLIEFNNAVMTAIETAITNGVAVKQIDAALIGLGYTPNVQIDEERLEYKQLLLDFKQAMESVIRDCAHLRPDMAKMRAEDMLRLSLPHTEKRMNERHGETI